MNKNVFCRNLLYHERQNGLLFSSFVSVRGFCVVSVLRLDFVCGLTFVVGFHPNRRYVIVLFSYLKIKFR